MQWNDSYTGDLLVASTEMPGGIFDRAVALLLYQDQQSVVGVMLNRPIQPAAGSITQPGNASPPRLPANPTTEDGDDPAPGLMISVDQSDPLAGQIMQTGVLHFGGPITGPLVAVHGLGDSDNPAAGAGIVVAAEREQLQELLRQHAGHPSLRLIVGHLGWSLEQLGAEIDGGIWHRLPATPEVLQSDDESMWPRLIRRATASSVARWIGAADHQAAQMLN